MSKSISAPLLRTARLLDLVPFLNTHQGIPLKELANHFDVTPAQMSADLTTLWMCGLPGYTPLELMDLEFESGFVSIRNAATLSKPRTISFQERVALLLGLDLIESSLPDDRGDLLATIHSLRQRLKQNLGVPIQLSVVATTSGVISAAIAQALQANDGLEINYHSLYKDQVSVRTVIPTNLYQSDSHQYLRAYCLTALDYREFRVDRITLAKPAKVSADMNSHNHNPQKIDFSITIRDSSRDVTERFGIMRSAIGSSIELSSYSRQWIERSVMASGAAIFLSSPSEIRSQIAKKAQLMLNRYKEA
jgi:proteasome accessory factor C